MNGIQCTLTDRSPNILTKDPTDKRPKFEKSSIILKHDFDQTGLVQRCVIIQRDKNGFGLTVSGDNPVFVQLVKEDGAAMRAGVQTGDRIIKVNGILVTHSNHIEVVKLIKSGSYVALTVLGRPPGLAQMVLEEEEEEDGSDVTLSSSLSGPNLPPMRTCSDQENVTTSLFHGDQVPECRNSESDDRVLRVDHGLPSRDDGCNETLWTNTNSMHNNLQPESLSRRETPRQSPNVSRRHELSVSPSPDTEDTPTDSSVQCIVGNPPYHVNPQIIGAEDDYFDSQQEQLNGECSSFQSFDLLKCRPAHLAAFLHHVISQFDPAPVLCYLYADLHKQTSSKESRRFFMEFHSIFIDRAANLKVPVPETIASELERRRLDLIPEDVCKQYSQLLQEAVLSDLHSNLEDFRQKRSMGLTLAEDELCKLDSEREKDQQILEKECCCAEYILSKIEDILMTSQPSEEEKCTTTQYVILTYMKHLGVKVKEPRGLEHKRGRINFLPKIKKSIRSEKDGEEKIKKPRFPNILVPPRRLSRVDSTSVGKAVELNRQCSPKLSAQPAFSIPEQPGSPAAHSGRIRGNLLSEDSEAGSPCFPSNSSSPHSSPTGHTSDTSGQTSDSSMSPFSAQPKLSETLHAAENQDGVSTLTGAQFDFSPSNTEQLQEEDQDAFSRLDAVSSADVQSEDEPGVEVDCEEDPLNWQALVSRGVLASLTPQEIKRQEVINELFYTERAHLRMLKVLDCVFCQRLNRHGILPPDDIKHIFTNLDEIIQLHASITEQMMTMRNMSETSVIGHIGDDLLSWFSGEEEEKIKGAAAMFCSNQPSALELIKTRKKKDQRFSLFMQKAESNRLCRRLQLKDIIPVEMQRLTKYPLLLDNIAKYTDNGEERDKVRKAAECCKKILKYVNQTVKEAENKQRLEEYQRRLDVSSLKQSENPMILELKNLDLTKRRMVHEGPLSWKVHKEKTVELYTILLEDILVLLQKQDERLVLKFHGKNVAVAAADTKHIFSPVIKLNSVLVRPVATDNKSLFVLSMSENGAQIYELMAQTVSDQRMWQCLITQCAEAMKAKPNNSDSPPAPADAEQEVMEIINCESPTARKQLNASSPESIRSSDKEVTSSPETHCSPTSQNPFEGLKSVDEEDEVALVDGQDEEEEVDEEELEAFLDGQLADGLQEGSHDHVTINNQEHDALSVHDSKAEDALKTLTMLKQVLFDHMMSRTSEEKKEETEEEKQQSGASEEPAAPSEENPPPANVQKDASEQATSDKPEANGGFVILDFDAGTEESSTDDDGLGGSDVVIDLEKLLSSSSQTGRSGPNLNRQLKTYLRLLQADLEYLKEVEMKFNQLQKTQSDSPTDSDDYTNGIQ